MYILIKDNLPAGYPLVVAAHSALIGFLTWQEDFDMARWVVFSFKKVICKVTEKEFEEAKQFDKCEVITESSLDNQEVGLVFCPREAWPEEFNKYKLFR